MPDHPTRRAVRLRSGGTVYEVTSPRGLVSWEITLSLGTKADGSRDQRRRRFPSKEAAERWRLETIRRHRQGQAEPGAVTVRELVEKWLALKTERRGANTLRAYRSYMDHHILPGLGSVRLDRLTTLRLQGHFDDLIKAGRPAPVLSLARDALKGALRQAVAWGMIEKNAAVGVVLPSWRGKRPTIALPTDETTHLLTTTADDPIFGALWHVLLATGLRIGEALALGWEDVDLERGVLQVRRHLTRVAGKTVIVAGGKTPRAVRPIALADETVAVLRRHKAVQGLRSGDVGDDWADEGLVFDRGDGRLLEPGTARYRLPLACKAAGVTAVTPHGLRRANATMLADATDELLIVQRRLGHARADQSLFYMKLKVDKQRAAAEKVASALRGDPDKDGKGG